MILVPQNPVVVLPARVTPARWVLSVLPNPPVAHLHMPALLPALVLGGRLRTQTRTGQSLGRGVVGAERGRCGPIGWRGARGGRHPRPAHLEPPRAARPSAPKRRRWERRVLAAGGVAPWLRPASRARTTPLLATQARAWVGSRIGCVRTILAKALRQRRSPIDAKRIDSLQ